MQRPIKKGNYIFINNAEIIANNSAVALSTGVFPEGSTLTIINNSYIMGYGGNGGLSNSAGQDGGSAVVIEFDCTIDNSNGYIYSGGGGGGGISVIGYILGNRPSHYFYMGGGGGCPNGKSIEYFSKKNNDGFVSKETYENPATPNKGMMDVTTYGASIGGIIFVYFTANTGAGGEFGKNGTSSELLSSGWGNGGVNPTIATTQQGGKAGLAIKKNGFNVTLINSDKERIKGEVI